MAYHYDNENGFYDEHQPPRPAPPAPGKNDSDIGSWIFIAVMFAVAWPVGLILLLSKLSDGGAKKKGRGSGYSRTAAGNTAAQKSSAAQKTAQAARNVTKTPTYSDKGAKTMKIIGLVLGILGCVAVLGTVADNLSFAYHYNEWWYFVRELFYPVGLTAGGAALLLGSSGMKRRQRRFATYLRVAGQKDAVPLDHLARAADVSRRRVEKDVHLMLEKGLWGNDAYVDLGNGMLFRSQEAATSYFNAVREEQTEETCAAAPAATPEGYHAILLQIRELNDRIADEALSAKMDRMEQVAGRIFKLIEEDEDKRATASTFLNYYLPTTLKLLENYAAFEEAGVSGENLTQAKKKIEQTMDAVVAGFEHQLDELYRAEAMDVESDIRVMETMLRRDTGSVADDFGLGGVAVQREEG